MICFVAEPTGMIPFLPLLFLFAIFFCLDVPERGNLSYACSTDTKLGERKQFFATYYKMGIPRK